MNKFLPIEEADHLDKLAEDLVVDENASPEAILAAEERQSKYLEAVEPAILSEKTSYSSSNRGVEGANPQRIRKPSVRVPSLGNKLFTDGQEYMDAPDIEYTPTEAFGSSVYKPLWSLTRLHEELMASHTHKQFIPHLDEEISKEEFHTIFRLTSTPVVIPFDKLRHLGVVTQGMTLDEMVDKYPFDPEVDTKVKTVYHSKSGLQKGLNLGPGLFALKQDKDLEKFGVGKRYVWGRIDVYSSCWCGLYTLVSSSSILDILSNSNFPPHF